MEEQEELTCEAVSENALSNVFKNPSSILGDDSIFPADLFNGLEGSDVFSSTRDRHQEFSSEENFFTAQEGLLSAEYLTAKGNELIADGGDI